MSRSSGTGIYGNSFVHREVSEFDEDARRTLDGLGPVKPKLTAVEIRIAHEEALRADEKIITLDQNASDFLSLHPELPDTKSNAKVINDTLKAMFGDCAYTVEQFETAFRVCRANNLLQLDKEELARQEQAAAQERAKAARERRANETRVYTEDEKDSMSLEELREAENREIKRRQQQLGEEGGYY